MMRNKNELLSNQTPSPPAILQALIVKGLHRASMTRRPNKWGRDPVPEAQGARGAEVLRIPVGALRILRGML